MIQKMNSGQYVNYADMTNTSCGSGLAMSSSRPDSLISITGNSVIVIQQNIPDQVEKDTTNTHADTEVT